jgi:hypothetical protein
VAASRPVAVAEAVATPAAVVAVVAARDEPTPETVMSSR